MFEIKSKYRNKLYPKTFNSINLSSTISSIGLLELSIFDKKIWLIFQFQLLL